MQLCARSKKLTTIFQIKKIEFLTLLKSFPEDYVIFFLKKK